MYINAENYTVASISINGVDQVVSQHTIDAQGESQILKIEGLGSNSGPIAAESSLQIQITEFNNPITFSN